MRQQTRELALASVLGALAVLFLFLGGVLPLALYACPLLASVCLLPVREECRASYQWCCFFAAAILGLLLGPDKESALLFCFLGYYPLLQPSLDAIGSRALRFLTKLGLYVLAVGAMYALLVFVFRLDAVTAELAATAPWLIAATFALGVVLLSASGGFAPCAIAWHARQSVSRLSALREIIGSSMFCGVSSRLWCTITPGAPHRTHRPASRLRI